MSRLIGLPIFAAIALGMLFPWAAISLMPAGFAFLMLLMFWAGLGIEWSRLPRALSRPGHLAAGLFFGFVFFPLLQWVPARLLVHDPQYLYGLLFSSLTPVAIVAPFFARKSDGDEELSFLLMWVSTLVAPFVAPLFLTGAAGAGIRLELFPIFKSMVALTLVPVAAAWPVARFLPGFKARVSPHLGLLNMLTLSALIFILFGTAVGRVNLSYSGWREPALLLGLAFVQDFGVLLAGRWIFNRLWAAPVAESLAVSLSMKNVAVAAGVLLFHDPKASLPAALGFVAHAFLFNWIAIFSSSAKRNPAPGA